MLESELNTRLEAALVERDEALSALARERERTNTLRLKLEHLGEVEPPRYPTRAGAGEPPLRYVLVDEVNDRLKAVLAPVHGAMKRLLSPRGKK